MMPATCVLRPAHRSFVRGNSASSSIRRYTLSRRWRQEQHEASGEPTEQQAEATEPRLENSPSEQQSGSAPASEETQQSCVAEPVLGSALNAAKGSGSGIRQLRFMPTEDGSRLKTRGDWNPMSEWEVKKRARARSGLEYGQLVFAKGSDQEGNLESRGMLLGQAKLEALEFIGTPKVLRTRSQVVTRRGQIKSEKKVLALVPTMGALHEGHLSLIRAAARANDRVWVSIFVNPAQFGPNEDLTSYPRTWNEDLEKLEALNQEFKDDRKQYKGYIDAIFAPTVKTMYPGYDPFMGGDPAERTYISVDSKLTSVLEGAARPTFFRGVATVVMKLFMLTQPDRAYFGQKDVQQLAVIKRMAQLFLLNVDIAPVPISRAEDGLALSSRNVYLGERRRNVATVLRRALVAASEAIQKGKLMRHEILAAALGECRAELQRQRALPLSERARFEVEYISLAGFHDMQEVDDVRRVKMLVLSGTIVMLPLEEPNQTEVLGQGGDVKPVRLLDNIIMRNPKYTHRRKIIDPELVARRDEEAQAQQLEGKRSRRAAEGDAQSEEAMEWQEVNGTSLGNDSSEANLEPEIEPQGNNEEGGEAKVLPN